MRYRVEDKKLVITGSLTDYGWVGWLTFNRGTYETRCKLDESIRQEWERREKPNDLAWIVEFEKAEKMRLLEAPVEK